MEYVLHDIKEKCKACIKFEGETTQTLKFAADIVLLSYEKNELEDFLNCADDRYIIYNSTVKSCLMVQKL